jgi:alpha-amylase
VATKEPGLAEQLHYDAYERRSGLVRFLAVGTDPEAWAAAQADELGDALNGPYEVASLQARRAVLTRDAMVRTEAGRAAVRVVKSVAIGGDRRSPAVSLTVSVENQSELQVQARLGIEWTLTMLGGGGNPSAWWEVEGERMAHDGRGTARDVATLSQGNDYIGIAVATTVSDAAEAWWAPVETVSNSESGFERVYQGAGLLLSWPLDLAPGASRQVVVSHLVTTTHDRGAEAMERLAATAARSSE